MTRGKPKSVGVKAAWIAVGGSIVAAIIGAVTLLIHKEPAPVIQTATNSVGSIQAARDVVINNNVSEQANVENQIAVAKDYDSRFENMTGKRAKAAIAIQEYFSKGDWNKVTNNTDGLDEVLGLFEIMGYDEKQGLISPDILHEYFYEDVVAYYLASKDYISIVQGTDGANTYSHIKPLYDSMISIEMQEEHKSFADIQWSKADLMKYFQSETNSVDLMDK